MVSRNSLLGSTPDPVGHFLVLQGHTENVLVIEAAVLHGLDEMSSLSVRHGGILLKDALEGPTDISSHRDVSTHIEMTPLFHQLLHYLVGILLQQVLDIHLQDEGEVEDRSCVQVTSRDVTCT